MLILSNLASNYKQKMILEMIGLSRQVGCIELGLCPECEEPIKPIKNKEALVIFDETGMCKKCQDGILKTLQDITGIPNCKLSDFMNGSPIPGMHQPPEKQ